MDWQVSIEDLFVILAFNIGFKWGDAQEEAFNMLKDKLISTPLLSLPNFANTFEIECNASNLGIRAVLMQ